MNRKLHNTLRALMASSFALVVGLMVANPGLNPSGAGSLIASPVVAVVASPATLPVEVAVAAGLADNFSASAQVGGETASRKSKSSRIRQSMAMPYFSFAPRG